MANLFCPKNQKVELRATCPNETNLGQKSLVRAMALVVGKKLPQIGTSVTYNKTLAVPAGVTAILSKANYDSVIYGWLKQQVLECGCSNGCGNSQVLWFKDSNALEVAVSEFTTMDNTTANSRSTKTPKGKYGSRTEMLKGVRNAFINRSQFEKLYDESDNMSIINFYDKQVDVADVSEYSIMLDKFGEGAIEGKAAIDIANGQLDFYVEGPKIPPLYDADFGTLGVRKDYLKDELEPIFGTPTVTGLTEFACAGCCKGYNGTFGTAFTIQVPFIEVTSCSEYKLRVCDANGVKQDAAIAGVIIDKYTGVVTGDATVVANEYEVYYTVSNGCFEVEKCIKIVIK